MRVSQANRGQALEQLIDFTNAQYAQRGIAQIDKVPTPVKVLRITSGRIRDGFYDRKGTVDYIGTYKGRSIIFDAKSTKQSTRFDLKNVHNHQVDYMVRAHNAGAVCFLLVEFTQHRTIFLLPLQTLMYYWDRRKPGVKGTQSIPLDDFGVYAIQVTGSRRAALDYLAAVERVWEREEVAAR